MIHYLGPVLATKGVSITKNTQRNILQKKRQDKQQRWQQRNKTTLHEYTSLHGNKEINKYASCEVPYLLIFVDRYGDRAPKSIMGRIFGIMWTLTGLVIISILIGAIASSLTSVTVERDVILYGTEVNLYENYISKKE